MPEVTEKELRQLLATYGIQIAEATLGREQAPRDWLVKTTERMTEIAKGLKQ